MNFLPHGRPSALSWYGSFAASFTGHLALVSFVVFSGVVILTPRPPEQEETPDFTVSLEILDADILEQLEPVSDENLVPENAVITEPDAPEAETPEDLAALAPDEEDLLAPEDETLLEPETDAALEPEALEPELQEPDVAEPDVTEPDVIEPEPVTPEIAQPEVIAPEPAQPEVADIQPEPENEPLLVPQDVIEPQPLVEAPGPEPQVADVTDLPAPVALPEPAPLPLPEVEQPLSIDDLSPIDDTVLNPLATGGSGLAPVDELALLAPEPEQPAATVLQPQISQDIAPVVLPEPEVDAPIVVAPDPEIAAIPEVVVQPEPEVSEPDVVAEPEPETQQPEVVAEPEPETPEIAAAPEPETPEVAPDLPDPDAQPEATPEPDTQTATAPTRAPLANPTASDIAIGQLLRRIRATPQEQCTLALPRRVTGDSALAGLSMVGAREDQLDALSARITDGLDFAPVQTRELLDPRQCAALDALRQSESYPANRIGLTLDTTTLASGDTLTGRIVGAGGLYVALLLVDDNGVVQDLAPFVTLVGTTPVFEAPVARSGPSRATRQVLMAIGTTGAPLDLSALIGQEAQQVFGQIPAQTLQNMVFGVATFDVQ